MKYNTLRLIEDIIHGLIEREINESWIPEVAKCISEVSIRCQKMKVDDTTIVQSSELPSHHIWGISGRNVFVIYVEKYDRTFPVFHFICNIENDLNILTIETKIYSSPGNYIRERDIILHLK